MEMTSRDEHQGLGWMNIKLTDEEVQRPLEDAAILKLPHYAKDADELSLFIDMLGLEPALDRRNDN
jgi:hypothetical protein